MEVVANHSNGIHLVLKELIDRKSKRDRKNFTICQLAKAINMPHSMLVKLIHPDPTKRVNNPRIDTLAKIVDFFKQDGFNITIDELLAGFKVSQTIKVNEQEIGTFSIAKSIPVYLFDPELKQSIGIIDIKLTTDSKNVIALFSDEDIKPIFKKGSIFIIDTTIKPEHNTLVAVKIDKYKKILIRKFQIVKQKVLLKSYDSNIAPIEFMPTNNHQIIGVVIQVNAKT